MGVVIGEEGLLKLVHPGRFVEIHRQPVTAAEVMRKNPRQCVARPDVFENPWIMVRTESVLHLGRVFFIVHNHTLHKLLKARGYHRHKQPSPQGSQSSKEYSPIQRALKQLSSIMSFAGGTPRYHDLNQFHKQFFDTISWERECSEEHVCGDKFDYLEKLFQAISLDRECLQEYVNGERCQPHNKLFQTSSYSDRECSHEQSYSKRFYSQYRDESLAEVISRQQHTYQEFRKKSMRDSTVVISSPHKDCNSIEAVSTRVEEHNALVNKCRNEATKLKSCFRKHDSA